MKEEKYITNVRAKIRRGFKRLIYSIAQKSPFWGRVIIGFQEGLGSAVFMGMLALLTFVVQLNRNKASQEPTVKGEFTSSDIKNSQVIVGQNQYIQQDLNVISQTEESPLEKRTNDKKYDDRCNGSVFDIVEELELKPVGGERFLFDIMDDHVVTVEGEYFQGSYKTSFKCDFPFQITARAIPLSRKTFGFFIEVEGYYKFYVGDGDMRTVKLVKNDSSIRGKEMDPPVFKEKLESEIEVGKEVIVVIESTIDDGEIDFKAEIYHSGFTEPEPFRASFVPEAVNFGLVDPVRFRVGVNDSRFEGTEAKVRLGTFKINMLRYQ